MVWVYLAVERKDSGMFPQVRAGHLLDRGVEARQENGPLGPSTAPPSAVYCCGASSLPDGAGSLPPLSTGRGSDGHARFRVWSAAREAPDR
jgi:hypothetical protein